MSTSTNTRRKQRTKIELAPALVEALRELAEVEGIDLHLLVTLLIRSGLDHRRGRAC